MLELDDTPGAWHPVAVCVSGRFEGPEAAPVLVDVSEDGEDLVVFVSWSDRHEVTTRVPGAAARPQ